MQRLGGTTVSRRDDFSGEPPNYWIFGTGLGAPGATPHAPGPWVEIDPATTEAYDGLDLLISYNTGGHAVRFMLELAVGAAGSEVLLAGPFAFGNMTAYRTGAAEAFVPVYVPRGSRLAARFQLSIAWPGSEQPSISLSVTGRRAGSRREAFGQMLVAAADAAATTGSVALPSSYGSTTWVELHAAVPFRVRHAIVNLAIDAAGEGAVSRLLELGVGAASSERGIGQFTVVPASSHLIPIVCDIAAGERIAIRTWPTSGVDNGRALIHLFG